MNLQFRTDVTAGDVSLVGYIVRSTGNFSESEIEIAMELVQERLDKGPESGYHFVFAELDGRLVSYTCFGPVPATKSSFDLYWIATLKEMHGRGVGRAVQAEAERIIASMGGTHVWIETSSRDDYKLTREFYIRTGARIAAILEDFYSIGDSKYIFVKKL